MGLTDESGHYRLIYVKDTMGRLSVKIGSKSKPRIMPAADRCDANSTRNRHCNEK